MFIAYSECVSVPLVSSRQCAFMSSTACPAVQYFSTLPHKRHDLGSHRVATQIEVNKYIIFEKKIERKIYVLILCSIFFSEKIYQDIIKMQIDLHVKYLFIFVKF
jgi:hypothetical protein